jgi:membrane fusion protein, adhesin transport system
MEAAMAYDGRAAGAEDVFNDSPKGRGASSLLWVTILAVISFAVWASVFEIDEVAVGQGKVTPSSKGQVVQSLEGGILSELLVKEGDIVEANQTIATLDPVLARSTVEEADARIKALTATAARLTSQTSGADAIEFPPELEKWPAILQRERSLFATKRSALVERIDAIQQQLKLAERELAITEPLQASGAASEVEVLRLRQKVLELSGKIDQYRSDYSIAAKEELSKVMTDLEPLRKTWDGRVDKLKRTTLMAPMRGIVKDIATGTIGGVVPPGGVLMEIVPLEDRLLIEANLSPRDIAFIRPGQQAVVKLTAYDPAIYGTLPAELERVSPDTIEDKTRRGEFAYRIYVRTKNAYLETRDGKRHPIIPGMIATTEIRTGRKTVMDYLLKPLNKASEALRER